MNGEEMLGSRRVETVGALSTLDTLTNLAAIDGVRITPFFKLKSGKKVKQPTRRNESSGI